MGLLASIASTLGKSGGEYAETLAKISAEKEAREAKDKAELEKEARIEEAWSKHHDITRGDQMVDQQWKLNEENKQKEAERLGKRDDFVFQEKTKHEFENDPSSLNYKKAAAAISQSEASVQASLAQASEHSAKAKQEAMKLDLQQKALAGDESAAQGLSLLEKGSGRTEITRNVGTDERPALQKGYVDYKGNEHFSESDKGTKPVYIKDKQVASDFADGMIVDELAMKFPNGRPEDNRAFGAVRPDTDDLKAQQKEYDDYKAGLDKTKNSRILELMGVNQQGNEKGGMLSNGDYNFGNVRNNNGVGFKDVKTPEAGVEIITDRMNRYADGIKTESNPTGKPATTLLEFTSIYAPKKDGNDPVAYAKMLSEKMGIGINDPVDLKDPEIQKMATPLIMLQENRPRAEKAFKDPRVMRAIANIGSDGDKKDNDKTPSANAVWNPKTGKIERI
jgi:hypothetical protein